MDLAATKLRPPVPPGGLVRRSRLDEILDAAAERHVRLVLLSAPAGSGKSTLLASWLAARADLVAWLQVEQSDSDPARFWSYLVQAIGRVLPDVRELTSAVVGSKGDDLVVVTALVNQLAVVGVPLIVVIDDYHLIDNTDVHRGMERLIELCPPHVTIVLSTRIDPPYRLGRLRVRDQVAEIRGADLRFATDEASGLLGPAGHALDAALLGQLCDRTEGWAAGLVLAGLSLKRAADPTGFVQAFRGDDRLVVEYLRDELLATATPDHRRRMLETSILEQLSGALVDAVTGTPGGSTWLSGTADTNQLLIRLDPTDTWFRYHHLLRDLLRLEAQRSFPERMPELHARAAAYFEAEGDHGQAVMHRIAAGDLLGAAKLLLVLGPRLLMDGQVKTLHGLLDQICDVARTLTWCALLYGWCEYLTGRYSQAEAWLDTMRDLAEDGFDHTAATSLRINLALARGDVSPALTAARDVIATDQLATHNCDLATATGSAYAWAGQAKDARRILRYAAERAAAERFPAAHVLALVHLAIVELDDGSGASAQVAACTAADTAHRFGLGAYHGVAAAYAVRARTNTEPVRAHADALLAVSLARQASTDLALGYVLAVCADTLIDLNDPAGPPLLTEARAILARCPDPGTAGRYLSRTESRHGIADRSSIPASPLAEHLTERELAVLRYLPAAQMSQRDIASELYVSLNTVKTHCKAIYHKLGVVDRKGAVQAARDVQLL